MARLSAKKKTALENITRESLLSAAERLLLEEGWRGATVERIAQEAGVAKGTVYNYFRDKREIFSSLLERNTETIRLFVHSADLEKGNPANLLQDVLGRILDNLYEKRGLIAATIQAYYEDMDLRRDFEPHHKMQQKHPLWEVRAFIREIIAKGVDTGVFRPLDPTMAEATLNAVIMGVAKQFAMDMVDFPGEAYMDTIQQIVLQGFYPCNKSA